MTLIHAQIWYKNYQSECVCKQWMVVNGSRNVYSSPPKLSSFLVWFLSEKVKDLLKYTKLEGRFAIIFCIKLQNWEVKIVFWLQVNISNQVNTNCWVNLKEREVEMTRSSTRGPSGKSKTRGVKNYWYAHVVPNLFYAWRQLQLNDVHGDSFLLALFCSTQAVPACTACP